MQKQYRLPELLTIIMMRMIYQMQFTYVLHPYLIIALRLEPDETS